MSARATDDAEELWARVLTELEAEIGASVGPADPEDPEDPETHAGTVYAGSGMWRAPAQLPVLPASLRARADALYRRQLEREHELRAERTQVLRHLEALRAVPRPRAAAASVYLDVAG